MLRSVWTKSLRDLRRSFLWWTLGLVGMVALIVAVYPAVRDNPAIEDLSKNYPEALKAFVAFGGDFDMASPAGYLGSELFSLMVPLLLLIAVVGRASGTLAGEEEGGTLDLRLANPISRERLALEKLAAVVLEGVGLGLVLWASLVVGARAVGMEIAASKLAAATGAATLLAIAFGAIAFALGAATGHRARATSVTAALAVASYLVNGLAPLVGALEHVQSWSPFYQYAAGDPLRHGFATGHGLVLLAIAAVASAAAPILFARRDLRT